MVDVILYFFKTVFLALWFEIKLVQKSILNKNQLKFTVSVYSTISFFLLRS